MITDLNKKIEKKKRELTLLKQENSSLQNEFISLTAQLSNMFKSENMFCIKPLSPQNVCDVHIRRLKEYNELRDIGLKLAQIIAVEKSYQIKEVIEEMGYLLDD